MSNPLLSGLQDAFDEGGELLPEGTTIKSLIRLTETWLEGRLRAERLVPSLEAMAGTVSQAAFATERDVREAESMAPELREPTELSLEAYRTMVAALERIQQGVVEGSRAMVASELEVLRESAQDLEVAQEAFQAWMESTTPRCPRCGATDPTQCAQPTTCPREFFIPDAEAAMAQSQQTATLKPEYVRAFEAYARVVAGEARLATLLEALKPLESQLEKARFSAQAVSHHQDGDPQALESLQDALLDSLDGIDQIRRAVHSRRLSDINQGWRKLFLGAVRIQGQSRELMLDAADPSRQAFITTEDSVQITGDD